MSNPDTGTAPNAPIGGNACMSRRKGWTTDDLNWLAWKAENFATLTCMAIIYCTVIAAAMGTLLTLGGSMQGGWSWLWAIAAYGALFVAALLFSAYPDPVVRLYLRITAGPRKDPEEITS